MRFSFAQLSVVAGSWNDSRSLKKESGVLPNILFFSLMALWIGYFFCDKHALLVVCTYVSPRVDCLFP
jgi:hypothetical protein